MLNGNAGTEVRSTHTNKIHVNRPKYIQDKDTQESGVPTKHSNDGDRWLREVHEPHTHTNVGMHRSAQRGLRGCAPPRARTAALTR